MEDQVLPLGLASIWAGSGAKYSWHGVCDCATKVSGFHNRKHEIYWYKGLDGRKILMKWYSLVGWINPEKGSSLKTEKMDHKGGEMDLISPRYSIDVALKIVADR